MYTRELSSPSYYDGGMAGSYYGMLSGAESGYGGQSYGASDSAGTNQALINLRVPPNAEVWFDDQQTTQTGSMRSFISPPLDPGQNYVYTIRTRWMQDGRAVERTRKLNVHAGDRLFASFMPQGPSGTLGQPDTGATPSSRSGEPGQPGAASADESITPPRTPPRTNQAPGTPTSEK